MSSAPWASWAMPAVSAARVGYVRVLLEPELIVLRGRVVRR